MQHNVQELYIQNPCLHCSTIERVFLEVPHCETIRTPLISIQRQKHQSKLGHAINKKVQFLSICKQPATLSRFQFKHALFEIIKRDDEITKFRSLYGVRQQICLTQSWSCKFDDRRRT